MTKKSSKLDIGMFHQLLDELTDMDTSELILFFKEYSRKNKEFKMDLIAYFAPKLDENELLYELILKSEYSKIMRQNSNKISKAVRKIFDYIEDFCFHIEDQIALKHHRQAMSILLPCLRYSSKVMFRIEANDKLANIHLKLHDLLAVLIGQIEVAQLKEELFEEVADIASAFYYYPSSSSNNLFALLVKLKNYGQDLEQLLLDKYQANENRQAKSILGLYIIRFYQENFDQISQERVEMMKNIIVSFHEDRVFVEGLTSDRYSKPLPRECESYLIRIHHKSKPGLVRELLFKKLFRDVNQKAKVNLCYEHLRSQYGSEIIAWITQSSPKSWNFIVDKIIQEYLDPELLIDQLLWMRLIRDVTKNKTQFFELFRSQFSLNLMKLFATDLFEMDSSKAYQILKEVVLEELNLHVGEKSIHWTNDILRQLYVIGRRREAELLRSEIQIHYGHRKQLAKALV